MVTRRGIYSKTTSPEPSTEACLIEVHQWRCERFREGRGRKTGVKQWKEIEDLGSEGGEPVARRDRLGIHQVKHLKETRQLEPPGLMSGMCGQEKINEQ